MLCGRSPGDEALALRTRSHSLDLYRTGPGGQPTSTAPDGTPLPPKPWNEPVRLAYLKSLGILDTAPERVFDEITALCCKLMHCPIGFVTLIDDNRVWFKSSQGVPKELTHLQRFPSLCSWALSPDEARMLIVPDTLEDVRFRNLGVVAGPPHVRFYAGVPLVAANGLRLGTLCVLDTKPREFDAHAGALLVNLAQVVVRELERRAMEAADAQIQAGRMLVGACDSVSCPAPGALGGGGAPGASQPRS